SHVNELRVGVDVTVPGLNANGTLFFLALNAQDDPANPSHFGGAFLVDLRDPTGDGKLTLSEFASGGLDFGAIVHPELNAGADINLKMTAGFGSPDFPSLVADFKLSWIFSSATGLSGSTPSISFNNVGLRIGRFFDEFLGPVVKTIHEVFDPIKPIIDFLS